MKVLPVDHDEVYYNTQILYYKVNLKTQILPEISQRDDKPYGRAAGLRIQFVAKRLTDYQGD